VGTMSYLGSIVRLKLLPWLALVSRAAFVVGFGLLAWPVFVFLESSYVQWSARTAFSSSGRTPEASEDSQRGDSETIVPRAPLGLQTPGFQPGALVAKMEVPRLGLSYAVLEGTASRTLDKGPGHVEGTAFPGETGNICIAGHRNTHFRPLEWIRRGDSILLTNQKGRYRYQVEWVRLFTPDDLYVLDPSHGPSVTVVTCFPFEYVGSAPLRFVVRALPDDETRAHLVSSSVAK